MKDFIAVLLIMNLAVNFMVLLLNFVCNPRVTNVIVWVRDYRPEILEILLNTTVFTSLGWLVLIIIILIIPEERIRG